MRYLFLNRFIVYHLLVLSFRFLVFLFLPFSKTPRPRFLISCFLVLFLPSMAWAGYYFITTPRHDTTRHDVVTSRCPITHFPTTDHSPRTSRFQWRRSVRRRPVSAHRRRRRHRVHALRHPLMADARNNRLVGNCCLLRVLEGNGIRQVIQYIVVVFFKKETPKTIQTTRETNKKDKKQTNKQTKRTHYVYKYLKRSISYHEKHFFKVILSEK